MSSARQSSINQKPAIFTIEYIKVKLIALKPNNILWNLPRVAGGFIQVACLLSRNLILIVLHNFKLHVSALVQLAGLLNDA